MKAQTLFLLISILITTFFWIALDLDHHYKRTYLPTVPPEIREAINPAFDYSSIRIFKGG